MKKYYDTTVIRKKILKARAFSGDTLLDRVKKLKNNDKLTLTYHHSFKNF